MFKKLIVLVVLTLFLFNAVFDPRFVHAQTLNLPQPGEMLFTTAAFSPLNIDGLQIHPNDPFKLDFIVNKGDLLLGKEEFNRQTTALIKYFLAALTVPEKELWVNLSPIEKDRIIPENFGKTGLGRDLLAQDYILKQLTSSLTYPERALGKSFWQRVYERAQKEFGITDIPKDTFNKIWIVPSEAKIFENKKGAFI